MKKIIAFDFVTLDGFFCGPNGEIDWFKTDDEFQKFVETQTSEFGGHIFGHTTYEMMKSYWSAPEALKNDPVVTKLMRETWKFVFSKSLPEKVEDAPEWQHVNVLREIDPKTVESWKAYGGPPLAIFGSGNVLQQMLNLGLVDELRVMVNPIILGAGKPLLEGVKRTDLELLAERKFGNGNILLTYMVKK